MQGSDISNADQRLEGKDLDRLDHVTPLGEKMISYLAIESDLYSIEKLF